MSRALPGKLPAGERILWQGSPDWRVLTRRVFHVQKLAVYFAAMVAYGAYDTIRGGAGLVDATLRIAEFAGISLVPLALLTLYAWGTTKATTYTVTTKRVVIKMGIALPMSLNLPFARIDGAAYRPAKDGSGDIALQLMGGDRIGYLILWPHARPWRLAKSEPMLRALPQGARVAQLLASALAASADMPAPALGELQGVPESATIGQNRPYAAAAA